MPGIFTDVEMVWKDKVHTIRSFRVMGAIAAMEEHITLMEMAHFSRRKTVPMARLCQAYSAVLKYAGAKVDADEIYQFAFSSSESQDAVLMAMMQLMMLASPADKRKEFQELLIAAQAEQTEDAGELDTDAGNLKAAGAASPKKHLKSRAGRGKKAVSA